MSEYERGRRDGLEQAAQAIQRWSDGWKSRIAAGMYQGNTLQCADVRRDEGTELVKHIRKLAATSGTPVEHDPARAPHNKFASLWCDACPRPASSTTNVREAFEKWYAVYKDITLYIDGMQDAFEAGYNARSKERDAQAAAPGGKGPPCICGRTREEHHGCTWFIPGRGKEPK